MKLSDKISVSKVGSQEIYDLGLAELKADGRKALVYGCRVSSKKSPTEPGHFSYRTGVYTKRAEALKDAARIWRTRAKLTEHPEQSFAVALPCNCIVAAVVADKDALDVLANWIADGRPISLVSDDDVRARFKVNCGHPLPTAPKDDLVQMRLI